MSNRGISKRGRAKASALDTAASRQRQAITTSWARRHPARAAAERALRVDHAKALADHPKTRAATPETHARAARVQQGAMARLHRSGAISIDQLGAALEIADVAEHICAGLGVRTVSLETRIDSGRHGGDVFWESLGRVRREMAYSRWRAALPHPAAPVLAMITEDCGMAEAARRFGIHHRRAKHLLLAALDMWPALIREACDEVDPATLAAAHAGLM